MLAKAAPEADDATTVPRFSVIWPYGGSLRSAVQCISSLEAQGCADFELVLQEDDSSPGTAEIVAQARRRCWQLRTVACGSGCLGQRLLDLLRQGRGDYIAFLPSEGRFKPQTFDLVARAFEQAPGIGGLCAPGFLVDDRGQTLPNVDIVTLLLTTCRPFLPAGFIARRALLAVGLAHGGWLEGALDLDLWSRLAIDHGIGQLDEDLFEDREAPPAWDWLDGNAEVDLADRIAVAARIFSREGFFGDNPPLAAESKANQAGILWRHFRALGVHLIDYYVTLPLGAVVREFQSPWGSTTGHLRSLHRLLCNRSQNIGMLETPLQRLLKAAARTDAALARRLARAVWSAPLLGYWIKRQVILLTVPTAEFHTLAPPRDAMFADVYALAAELYAGRGQIDLALQMWQRARPPDDQAADSRASQEFLRLPGATDARIADHQREWASRHCARWAAVEPAMVRSATGDRKIRIGYHCCFMNSDTVRYMMRNVLRAHDRGEFVVHGYAPGPLPEDISGAFDSVHDTSETDREAFVRLIRSHGLDVFVELSGFSPGHRFAEMSARCAPVQVSFLNHPGSSHVPNVDYVLADEISIPTGSPGEQHYSEHIYRLPNCFFCFDYRGSPSPDVGEPPSASRPYVTFGCFGSGAKLNRGLIELWSRLLHAVPSSRLWLQNPQLTGPNVRRFVRHQFEQLGIDGQRLILRRGVPRDDLLPTYRLIDISLDTAPYCGGCSVAESFWMGVPVVTLKGDKFSSRYGASLVTAAGCADLVAETPERYVEIAANLAADLPRLRRLRHGLRHASIKHGLGDSEAFARNLENAYRDMLSRIA